MLPRRTKIVATLGPATSDPAMVDAILEAGVNVCRINCSHSGASGIRKKIRRVRAAAERANKPVAVLLDLQGPKIRISDLSSPIEFERGDVLEIVMDDRRGSGLRCGTTYPALASDLTIGNRILFSDGRLAGRVDALHIDRSPEEVHVRMSSPGRLLSHSGINVPGGRISAHSVTEKDVEDLAVGVEEGIDYVAMSFVRTADDVHRIRAELERLGAADTPVIVKVERPEALDNLDAILDLSDGMMVARGDLGVEMPIEALPIHQKNLIRAANRRGRLVITATQMLDSMERNPRPTRAETTDVANAILDGTDAVMLSGETAIGAYPVESVEVMDRIAREVEQSPFFRAPKEDERPILKGLSGTVAHAASYALQGDRPLMVFTWSGDTAILASKLRPSGPLFALAHFRSVYDRMSLVWGATPLQLPFAETTDELITLGEKTLLEAGLLEPGQEVVVLAGSTPMRGATNMMKLLVVGGNESRHGTGDTDTP